MTQTERTTIRRRPERGRYDAETVHAILDETPICTVSFAIEGRPVAIPATHARIGNTLYLHGSPHVLPGRWHEVQQPSAKEIASTRIVAISLDEASAKIRTGPIDDESDLVLARLPLLRSE